MGMEAKAEAEEMKMAEEAKMAEMKKKEAEETSIAAVAMNSADHTTLVAAVKAAQLDVMLKTEGPYTVFAPSNDAFDRLPKGTVDTLLKHNKMKINKLLLLGALATLSFTACKNDKKAEEEAEKMEMEAKAEAEEMKMAEEAKMAEMKKKEAEETSIAA